MVNVHVQMEVATAVRPSPRVLRTAAMFGLGVDEQRTMQIVPPLYMQLVFGGIVFITGPSGGGKSTMLALIAAEARAAGRRVINLGELPRPEDAPLVELFDRSLQATMELLSLVGLGDAFVMLRRPCELSDGQRARLRLAQAIDIAERGLTPSPFQGEGRGEGRNLQTAMDAGSKIARMPCVDATGCCSSTTPTPRPSPSEGEGVVIIADEFAATLDRLTARNLAASLRRWVSRTRHALVLATSHDDLLEALNPDALIVKGLGDQLEIVSRRRVARSNPTPRDENNPTAPRLDGFNLAIEPARLRDYQSLARFHYRRGRPAVVTTGFKLVHHAPTVVGRYLQRRDETQIVAVLLRSLPHLGCAMRDLAVRGRYRGLSRREAALMLNREVRSISRVVVDPRWRGLGLAAALVRHALDYPEPDIVLTEALATMGQVHPFFEKAGMTRYQRPPRPPQARLGDALAQLAIPLETLASSQVMRGLIDGLDEQRRSWLQHELRRFAQATRGRSGGSRRRNDDLFTIADLVRHAREHLLNLPVYYAFVHSSPSPSEGEGRGEGAFTGPAPRRRPAPTAGEPAR